MVSIARRVLGLVLLLIGLWVSVAVGGRSTRITCRHVEGVQVDCTTQAAPLGISWGEERTIRGVLEAAAVDLEGLGRTFVLALETKEGTIFLDGDATVDEKEAAGRINAFLQAPGPEPLVVDDVDWGRLVVGVFFVGGFLGVYPGLYLLFAEFWRGLARRIAWRPVLGAASLLFGLFCLFVFGRVTLLTCTPAAPGRVDCLLEHRWAGLVPLGGARTVQGVLEAEADRRRSSNPSPHQFSSYSHHLTLRTEQGVAAAVECFTYPQAQEMAGRVNGFIADPTAGELRVDNVHWVSTSLGLACVVLPCAVLSGVALIGYSRRRKESS